MSNNIDILIFVKNNCKLDVYITSTIDIDASNDDDEITIVIIQTITKMTMIFLNYENLCDEREIFIINSTTSSSTKKTFE